MANKFDNKRPLTVALLGGDHFSRLGIAGLLKNIIPTMQIKASSDDYSLIDTMCSETPVDVIFMSGLEKYHAGYDCLKYIKSIKARQPDALICMYSAPANSWLWIRGDIDAYISLQDPLYHWRASVLKMVDNRYRPIKKPTALSLTPGEWRVLKELRKGLDMRYIAETEQLSYRRVSALKSSAIRKLGLRNKTDLLVFLTS
ncbi:LuxR C-terminal-related transcriptional regulator [Enterobacter chuandaensis]|uniref:helix-turn-helix transcriptional regulator n=1 Tax=Enterobacter chuandaensis TaxID=2497875 RepID=UPI003D6E20EB